MQQPPQTALVGDEPVEPAPEALDPALVRALSELRPALSTAIIAREWVSIFGAASLCMLAWSQLESIWARAVVYVLAIAFIGARQHGLLVLAHDAAHYRLFR